MRSPARCGTVWRGHFASSAVRFVLADAGSTDGTREAAREIVGPSALVEVEYERGAELGELPYHGQPGHAAALRAILQTAQRLNAKACAVIDASLHDGGTGLDRTTHRARADRRVRLRLAVLRPARQRGSHHQGHRVSDVQGAVRRAAAPAGRQRVRLFRAFGGALPASRTSGMSSRRRSGSTSGWLWPRCSESSGPARRCSALAGRRRASHRPI